MKINGILVGVFVVALSGCATSPEALRIEMGAQVNNPSSIEKVTDHPDPLINTIIDAGIEAAKRLGFAYDASGSTSGNLVITAQWKGSPVVLRLHFSQQQNGVVGYSYLRECNGNVVVEGGDAKLLRLFEETLAERTKSRAPLARGNTPNTLQGTIDGGRYKHPHGEFSIAVPRWAVIDGGIEDHFISYAGRVAFEDKAGRYAILEIVRADDPADIERLKSITALDEIMKSMVNTYKAGLPTELLYHDEMKCARHTGRFFVCQFTGGATIVDEFTGRRPDCYRAYFIFLHGPTLYTLTTQTVRAKGGEWSPALRERMKEELAEFVSGIEFSKE